MSLWAGVQRRSSHIVEEYVSLSRDNQVLLDGRSVDVLLLVIVLSLFIIFLLVLVLLSTFRHVRSRAVSGGILLLLLLVLLSASGHVHSSVVSDGICCVVSGEGASSKLGNLLLRVAGASLTEEGAWQRLRAWLVAGFHPVDKGSCENALTLTLTKIDRRIAGLHPVDKGTWKNCFALNVPKRDE